MMNYKGIVEHDGLIRVKDGGIPQQILNKTKNTVLLKSKESKKESYVATIHKKLGTTYLETWEDIGFIRFKR